MIRIVLENLILLLLPTVVYFAYLYLTAGPDNAKTKMRNDAPLIWLFTAGVILVIVTLAFFASTDGGTPGQKYVPPVYEDGKIVPGHLE